MRRQSTGLYALLLIGGFFAWRNRFRIRQFLETQGIDLPLSTRNVGDFVKSGVAKVSGNIEGGESDVRKASGY